MQLAIAEAFRSLWPFIWFACRRQARAIPPSIQPLITDAVAPLLLALGSWAWALGQVLALLGWPREPLSCSLRCCSWAQRGNVNVVKWLVYSLLFKHKICVFGVNEFIKSPQRRGIMSALGCPAIVKLFRAALRLLIVLDWPDGRVAHVTTNSPALQPDTLCYSIRNIIKEYFGFIKNIFLMILMTFRTVSRWIKSMSSSSSTSPETVSSLFLWSQEHTLRHTIGRFTIFLLA